MRKVEFNDIQGLIVRGYTNLPASCFLILEVTDKVAAKNWLGSIAGIITHGEEKTPGQAVQISFTSTGLQKLGVGEDVLNTFSHEFKEGMTTEHRERILGDMGASHPDNWEWGSPKSQVDIVLMVYAVSEKDLDTLCQKLISDFKGVKVLRRLDSDVPTLQKRKEHFGFHDGISQPIIVGFSKQTTPEEMVELGEFVLGYRNEYLKFPDSPSVTDKEKAIKAELPLSDDETGNFNLGKNGSYMVFRQIGQDVHKFWKFMDEATREENCPSEEKRIKLASRMVGRWPSGAPLVESPDQDNVALSNSNSFDYHSTDKDGLKCPFGSHVRRSNPRNSLDPTPEESAKINKRHRILRRGRPYGSYIPSTDPEAIANHEKANENRGLYFICFNTSISRQFEFIQDTWVNSAKFAGLYNDPDPITGNPKGRCPGDIGDFTIQALPLRQRVTNVPNFTVVVGGAYFFMPGLRALKYIASV